MKFLIILFFSIMTGSEALVTNKSKAQTPGGWFHGGTASDGYRLYIKPLGCDQNNFCRAIAKGRIGKYKVTYNCNNWTRQTEFSSEWDDIMPGTNGDNMAKIACRN